MRYLSTNNLSKFVSFETAVRNGLPEDNGLYMPETIPVINKGFIEQLSNMSLPEIGLQVLNPFVGDTIPDDSLSELVNDAFSFETPLVQLDHDTYTIELFHGPTLAFKDIGARFMARCLGHFNRKETQHVTVLVATSGDTGSAVASGFLAVDNVDVCILYPKGKISEFQEKQMTTLGHNIHAIEIRGTFDDCQKLVKTAFLDTKLSAELGLTSANSINIARLLPQIIYYFYAYGQLANKGKQVAFSVPCGNYGNLTAGLIAKIMGLPIAHFIASTNANDIVPQYLKTGKLVPRQSVQTISNAMDVGDPSNFVRLKHLFHNDFLSFQSMISGYSFSDNETKGAIRNIYDKFGYKADPHGAVGYLGLKEYLKNNDATGVFLETAHPFKFNEVVEQTLDMALELPASFQHIMDKNKVTIESGTDYDNFRNILFTILSGRL